MHNKDDNSYAQLCNRRCIQIDRARAARHRAVVGRDIPRRDGQVRHRRVLVLQCVAFASSIDDDNNNKEESNDNDEEEEQEEDGDVAFFYFFN
jgi:hypothetical protein